MFFDAYVPYNIYIDLILLKRTFSATLILVKLLSAQSLKNSFILSSKHLNFFKLIKGIYQSSYFSYKNQNAVTPCCFAGSVLRGIKKKGN